MRRLGRNQGGYHGETIDLERVLGETVAAGERHGWGIETIRAGSGLDLVALSRGPSSELGGTHAPGARSPHRPLPPRPASGCRSDPRRLYVSAGIHGDEPAGPLAIRRLVEVDRGWPPGVEIWLCPCLNPTGFREGRRENAQGADLNRDFREPRTPEVRALVEWLGVRPLFDLALCLHEDWEAQGFYLYELNPDGRPSPAEAVVREVSVVCPIDPSPLIEGREAENGVIRPLLDPARRPDWPESFYLIQHKTRHSFTLEAPSDYALEIRVAALVRATAVLLNWPGEALV